MDEETKEAKMRSMLLVCFVLGELTNGCLFFNMISFFPNFAVKRFGKDTITPSRISFCITALELAAFFTISLYNRLASSLGRKTTLILGWVMVQVATVMLGLLGYVHEERGEFFFWSVIVSRILQGFANNLVMTSQKSIIVQVFRQGKTKALAFLEAGAGLGSILGPVLGSIIYSKMGYHGTFYVFALQILANVMFTIYAMPTSIDQAIGDRERVDDVEINVE